MSLLPSDVTWPVLLECKRLLEPPYLDTLKRTRAIPNRSSSSYLSLSLVIDMAARLCSTTRAPSDYLPTPALLPLDTDKQTLLANAVAQNVTAPLPLSCVHPSYHPPLPLSEEIQMSQLFKLHKFVQKTTCAGAAARAALVAEKEGRGGAHRVTQRPPLHRLWESLGGESVENGGKRVCRRPEFLSDWLSATKDDEGVKEGREEVKQQVWLREEVKHGRPKVRIIWQQESRGGNSLYARGNAQEGVILNPPSMELVQVEEEHEIVFYSNHSGAVVIYSLYDSAHLSCCGTDISVDEIDDHNWSEYCSEPCVMSSRGWFVYDDRHRPRVKLVGTLSVCAYVHMPAVGWADSPYLTEVLRKAVGEETKRAEDTKTKWSYSLFMDTGGQKEEDAESEGSEKRRTR
eukprot:GHVS01054377.1.p1 GENE.GHVS01054377.1~~GHVS01054377.1.p1  ORF type:complete len:402 (+),score=75.73 GHVS01054377.1:105-1310(+)